MAVDNRDSPARLLPAFVGRERELAELRAGLEAVAGGRGCLFLIAGEPGIGKTRLAEEVAAGHAAAVWGRCWEGGGAPAFWPWIQVFRRLADLFDPSTLRAAIGDAAGPVASLAPEFVARAGGDITPSPHHALDSEQDRFLLFDAACGVLRRLAEQRPLLLLFDDLHAADESSLLLIEFLSRELRNSHLAVVGTYREIEVQHDEKRAGLLHSAVRNGYRLPLAGLGRDEVERMVRRALGDSAGETRILRLAARIHRSTEGNPFFVDEVLRLVLAAPLGDDAELPLPHGVRDAVRERLRPLSSPCRTALTGAAVVGREFDLILLEAVAGTTVNRADLIDNLGEAERAGVVVRLPDAVGRYSFAHALIRETLYEEIAPSERARLHWEVAEALARQAAATGNEPLAELAHHALRGVACGDPARAVDFATRAGHRAAAQLAYEEAAECFRQALDALTLAKDTDLALRAEILLACGEAEAQAWNTDSAQVTFDRAAAAARELQRHDPETAASLLARAALGYGRTGLGVPRGSQTDPALVARLDEAMDALGSTEPALRARVLARLAVELYYSDATERRAALAREAAELARGCDDISALAYVVCAQHFALWDSPDVTMRLALADEAVRTAQRANEPDTEVVARLWKVLDVVESGDFERWERELDGLEKAARALRQPRSICFALTARAMRALWYSRFDEVEALGAQAVAIGGRAQDTAALVNYGLQRFAVQRARGAHDLLLPEVDSWSRQLPGNPVVDCARALLHADMGNIEEAKRHFALVAGDDYAALRRVNGLCNVLCWVAETCVRIGDRDSARLLEADLRPRAQNFLAFAPRIPFGPGAHWLGIVVALRGDYDEACTLLADAARRSRLGGGAEAAAWSEYELARILIERDGPGDRDRARGLLRDSAAVAGNLGLIMLGRRVAAATAALEPVGEAEALRATSAAGNGTSHGKSASGRVLKFPAVAGDRLRVVGDSAASGQARYTLRREGEFWSASDGETVVRLKDSKGLTYLAQLLRAPDREFHVLDLIAAERDRAEPDPSTAAGNALLSSHGMHPTVDAESGDKLIDAQARSAYQRRLRELREELDEATRFNDTGRAERARGEIEFLARELARAVGIGGRDRTTRSGAERARVNVTRAVKAAIRRISRTNPNLGRYLETTIHTGMFCSYRPDPRMKVAWRLS